MRDQPTKAEKLSAEALAAAFRNAGHDVALLVDRDKYDRPDILLEISGLRVACECVQIPPAYIYRDQHSQPDDSDWNGCDLLSMLWPNEPHQWIAEALAKKEKLVPDYLERSAAKEAWLLVHSPPDRTQSLIHGDEQWVKWALRHGTEIVNHSFAQIHLWTPQDGIHPLYERAHDDGRHRDLVIDCSEGYPTLCVNRTTLKFTTPEESSPSPNTFSYQHSSSNQIVVEPVDPKYKKHEPAARSFVYQFQITAWPDRAVMETVIEFLDEDSRNRQDPWEMDGLEPGQDYWCHYLHEFRAPKSFKVSYQPRDE